MRHTCTAWAVKGAGGGTGGRPLCCCLLSSSVTGTPVSAQSGFGMESGTCRQARPQSQDCDVECQSTCRGGGRATWDTRKPHQQGQTYVGAGQSSLGERVRQLHSPRTAGQVHAAMCGSWPQEAGWEGDVWLGCCMDERHTARLGPMGVGRSDPVHLKSGALRVRPFPLLEQ